MVSASKEFIPFAEARLIYKNNWLVMKKCLWMFEIQSKISQRSERENQSHAGRTQNCFDGQVGVTREGKKALGGNTNGRAEMLRYR